ncbi:Ger(x)C family spore germination protein [Paenibacillus cremeus]|uniref:Ger(X)C family spore germination protein n=1 Tax=Paenibacillus cremeus TaxID=2163881 RepID=A0A559KH14_9BACL|nr:Ger(x)C family spore germination protein [Paenibacillus cremeus]TVY11414.1 Ger(x)C family spore germination protein [Paenibacillus cremeus]
MNKFLRRKGISIMKMVVSFLLASLLLSGCVKNEIIDRIKILQSLGIDIQGDTIKSSGSYASYEKNERSQLLTGEAQSFNGAVHSLNAKSDELVVIGQLRTFVISEKYARKSIQELASNLLRGPLVSNRAYVIITKQEISSILSETVKNPPFYLSDLIKQNMVNANTPLSNTHLLLDQYYGEGQDMYLPVLDKDENGVLHMDGVGVFKEDKLHLFLSDKEALFLKILKDISKTMTGTYEFMTKQKELINLKILHGKHNIMLEQKDTAVISLKLAIDLKDLPKTKSSMDKGDLLEIKQQIEQHFASEIRALLKKFQMNAVDPIGFGEIYRSKDRNWNEREFKTKTYPNIKFEVKPEIIISQSGVGIGAEKR